ncbi:MAG: potassium/proton antiporter [Proteobacteria bacterium]|nr:MAG: potassium/proton antiporter [Pseudomonadota bacterium]
MNLHGSGFLAVYIAGLVLGNRPLLASVSIQRFHDGIAWLAQIVMFLMLGLLVTPSALLPVALPAMAVAVSLIFVARPLAVWLSLLPFGFPARDQAFIGWVGLRGAVPIILALFPLLADLPNAPVYFNVAFFVVMISLVLQGWTLAPLARRLNLEIPYVPGWNRRLELDLPGQLELELVVYVQERDSAAIGQAVDSLTLPDGASIAGLIRDGQVVRDYRQERLTVGDQLLVLVPSAVAEVLDRILTSEKIPERLRDTNFYGEFVLDANATLRAIADAYGIALSVDDDTTTLNEQFHREFKHGPVVGDRLSLGPLELVVRETEEGEVIRVGLKIGTGDTDS